MNEQWTKKTSIIIITNRILVGWLAGMSVTKAKNTHRIKAMTSLRSFEKNIYCFRSSLSWLVNYIHFCFFFIFQLQYVSNKRESFLLLPGCNEVVKRFFNFYRNVGFDCAFIIVLRFFFFLLLLLEHFS
jgi:hypothetical protein